MTLQLYRGTKSGLPTLAAGRPGWATDAHQLFVGDGSVNYHVGGFDWKDISTTTYTVIASDRAKVLGLSNAAGTTITLPSVASAGAGFCVGFSRTSDAPWYIATSGGVLVISAHEAATVVSFAGYESAVIMCDGSNWYVLAASRFEGLDSVDKGSTYTIVGSDRGKVINATTGTWALNLSAATSLGAGFCCGAYNSGSGVITITPASSNIRSPDGSAATLALNQGEGAILMSDGTNWYVVAWAKATALSDGDKGDITVSGSGATWTIDNNAVSNAKLRDSASMSVIGRSHATVAGDPADIVVGTNEVLGDTGGGLGGTQVLTGHISTAAVTYAKIQDVSAASRLLGRGSASGSGDVEEISLGTGLSMSGTTLSASGSSYGEGCRVYDTSNQSINNTTDTAITFDSERYDSDAFHSTSSNTSRITIPSGKAGKYLIGGCVRWDSVSSPIYRTAIRLNGSTIIASVEQTTLNPLPFGSTPKVQQNPSCIYDLAVGDYVELVVRQESGGAVNVEAAGNYSPEFWATRIRA